MNNRILGVIALVGSPMLLIEYTLYRFEQHGMTQLLGAMSLLYIIGWICSMIGMYRLRATGHHLIGRGILTVQVVLLVLAALWALLYIPDATPNQESIFYQVTDVAWPLSHVFMLITGIAAAITGVFQGLYRYAALLAGLSLVGSILVSIVAGDTAGSIWFSVVTALGFGLLGYAVLVSEEQPALRYASHAK